MKMFTPSCSVVGTFLLAVLLGWTDNTAAASPGTTPLVSSNTAFALGLYGQLGTVNAGNLFFSPYNISTCLGMTYAGARGDTETQMAQALHFSTNQAEVGPAFGVLQAQIEDLQKQTGIELTIANGLWAQKDFPFLADFLANATNNYQAILNQADFVTQFESVRGTINQWVADQTQGQIVNLLAPGTVRNSTRLVLVNAIYFKSAWASNFDTNATIVQPFHASSSQTVNASLMHQTEFVGYYENASFQAVELPYAGTNVAMVVLLPKDPTGLSQLEASLTPQELAQVSGNLVDKLVDVFLPRFKFEMTVDLIPELKNMGMTNAFIPGSADFSGMDGTTDLSINTVVHKALVDVNENGTVAAAATGVGVISTGIPIVPVFRADHPFIFMIRDTRSGSILFLGRVVDPTDGSEAATVSNIRFTPASFGVRTNQFGFNITGTSNIVVVVEACANLANPIWSAVSTNTLTGGSASFSDPQWTNCPIRLYRVRSP
jgi:serpin B